MLFIEREVETWRAVIAEWKWHDSSYVIDSKDGMSSGERQLVLPQTREAITWNSKSNGVRECL